MRKCCFHSRPGIRILVRERFLFKVNRKILCIHHVEQQQQRWGLPCLQLELPFSLQPKCFIYMYTPTTKWAWRPLMESNSKTVSFFSICLSEKGFFLLPRSTFFFLLGLENGLNIYLRLYIFPFCRFQLHLSTSFRAGIQRGNDSVLYLSEWKDGMRPQPYGHVWFLLVLRRYLLGLEKRFCSYKQLVLRGSYILFFSCWGSLR